MDFNVKYTYFEQFSHETTFDYQERPDDYINEQSIHGLLEYEVIMMFLDGMLKEERTLERGSILNYCVRDV